jgi:hypothetical protein
MNDVNPQVIKDTLSSLRNVKSSLFLTKKVKPNFKNIIEVCRFIDVLMLPLFYIWEKCCQKNILELGVEKHLTKPYERFLHDPLSYTWKFYLFLKLGIPSQLSTKTRKKVLSAYELLINDK